MWKWTRSDRAQMREVAKILLVCFIMTRQTASWGGELTLPTHFQQLDIQNREP
jgi:hypothetical protein